MDARVKMIYNDCWSIYKEYLGTHDMKKYNGDCIALVKKHECCEEVKGLLFWFAGIVNELHENDRRENGLR